MKRMLFYWAAKWIKPQAESTFLGERLDNLTFCKPYKTILVLWPSLLGVKMRLQSHGGTHLSYKYLPHRFVSP